MDNFEIIWLFFWVVLAALTPGIVVLLFLRNSLMKSYEDIFGQKVIESWQKIISAVIVIASLSGGLSLYQLERYIFPAELANQPLRKLNGDSITFEAVRALLDSANAVIHVLLVLLITSVIVLLILKVKGLVTSNKTDN
ncbi:hypothetical protein AB4455_06520 [Vibrio sp. 10N.261.46.E12]|uniref:hypothetical protein n=1 Tax=unclassified Vibrio TaxID=2614977 RepID=UPI000978C4C1|nr:MULTISPECIES: hypothetical protein [unclassified Vibrio]OMO37186.1 hypothetical protein BH584_23760 [Vibrio sp. 10N.261.45.E1]PMJ25781.1 hypothetical protein BCU27_09975 [Vibrio sp. 10N.286.45.B6]PML84424.1 hypothetical protein BCT66_17415 [Vibrio sp. 10N.261.49.E11]PMM90188.1 hypothetical protein BCT46_23770 [Vibrio sp. 10N.261.46.E8]PMN46151.1 hypothetical protein BCT32_11190 [Vibrio sp. 10N.261.45.E11]